MSLGNLAIIYQNTGRIKQAEQTSEQALAIHREVGNRRFEGLTLCNRAVLLVSAGGTPDVMDVWRQGAAILRELKDNAALERKITEMREACAKAGVEPFDTADSDAE